MKERLLHDLLEVQAFVEAILILQIVLLKVLFPYLVVIALGLIEFHLLKKIYRDTRKKT